MPLMLELKYEHFIGTWPGRIKCVELVRIPLLPVDIRESSMTILGYMKNLSSR